MMKIRGSRLSASALNKHTYICDILYLDGPILSLFTDKKQNWFYLWCDTDSETKDRWLLFPVRRADFVGYLNQSIALRALIETADTRWMLDVSQIDPGDQSEIGSISRDSYRFLRAVGAEDIPGDYWPAADSYFDESLSSDISLALEVNPSAYHIPIDGSWFFADLDRFSSVYSQLYAFLYCTKPRFVTNLERKVARYLTSPWKGGFSRVNLFTALQRMVPSIHDLQIQSIQYHSPGEIRIEALKSVGEQIGLVVSRYITNQAVVTEAEKGINGFLTSARLKRRDASVLSDAQLGLTHQNIEFLTTQKTLLGAALSLTEEFAHITSDSPNTVVACKVVTALVKRIRRLAEFQQTGLIYVT